MKQSASSGGGMRTQAAVGLTVLICALGGLLLAAGLATGFTALERRAIEVAGESGLVRDLDRLEADLSQWLTSLDLVLASGQTHFAQDAVAQGRRLQRLLSRIDAEAIVRAEGVLHGMIEQEVKLVSDVASGLGPAEVLETSDALLEDMVGVIDSAVAEVRLDVETRRNVLRRLRTLLTLMAWVAGLSYLLIVILTWRWVTSFFVKPLSELAHSAEEALQSGQPFTPVRRGPHEVQQLAGSLEAFAGNLEQQVQDRTAQLRTMLSELDHRVKNNLATVIALCEQTGRGTPDHETFERAFIGRLRAMASAHELLAGRDGRALQLRKAVDGILDAWVRSDSGRVRLIGDDLKLPSEAATPICLVLNELATNAAKYGAFSTDAGTLELSWAMEEGNVRVTWMETGGPPISGPPETRGLGLDLIEGLIQHQLRGTVTWSWVDTGMQCEIAIPGAPSEQARTG